MNNPFDLYQNKEAQTEQESSRLRLRVGVLLGLFCALLVTYVGVLVSVQIVNGEEYLENASYTMVQTETVETVRGDIVDTNGSVFVTNTQSYNIVFDTSLMGTDRNQILSDLIALCRAEDISWTDNLPISKNYPWIYTRENPFATTYTNDEGETVTSYTFLGSLAKKLKLISDPAEANLSAEELLTAMCEYFLGDDAVPDRDSRALVGVLYELSLRTYEVTYNEYTFAYNIDMAFMTKVKERSFPGVEFDSTTSRYYEHDLAPHVIGYTGAIDPDEWPYYKELGYPMNAFVGKAGVELAFEEFLHGSNGIRRIETDETGNIISEEWAVEPHPGNHVVLTLDQTVQAVTEEKLAEFVNSLEDPAGAAAAMVGMDGSVIALASFPDYNLSTFRQDYNGLLADPHKPLTNRATHGLYAPGSTFKPLVAIAALSEGIITPLSTVVCTGRYYYYPDYHPACWILNSTGGNHASETVSEAITDSCNIFFYDVGRRLGIDKIVEYASLFGLGQKTGIEIGEEQGRVAGPETSAALGDQWFGGQVVAAAIGQDNNQYTPLQLANYIATLVNGGNNYEVHLLDEVKSSDYSETVYKYEPVLRHSVEISDSALAAVKKGMYDLSKTYTMNLYFSSLPFEVGCKTGTAEVAGSTSNAVFVCFAPYDNPEVALCIVAEKGASGGSLASIAASMLSQYFATKEAQSVVNTENTLIP